MWYDRLFGTREQEIETPCMFGNVIASSDDEIERAHFRFGRNQMPGRAAAHGIKELYYYSILECHT